MDTKNTAIVILGASGDLAQRKLLPALKILYGKGIIDDTNTIIGSGRTAFTHEEFRKKFGLEGAFSKNLHYHSNIPGLKAFIKEKGSFERIIFFFSLPPSVYASTARALIDEGFGQESSIIIEKPFGYDYESARVLNAELHKYFDENRLYRIDHYLGKEAVQNILVFRFANAIFEPLWSSRYIESIQINAFETLGLEGRAAYFDNSGIMRDMMQNHLMQLLCLMTMEAPISLGADDIRSQKTDVLRTMKIEACHRYQYEGYTLEKGVKDDSNTDTYSEIKFSINNFRWTGTPIYMRTGKAVNRQGTEIGIRFRAVPKLLFNEGGDIPHNQIIFKIQPNESIFLNVSGKVPGADDKIESTRLKFFYREAFKEQIPEAYQKLLTDVLRGDQTLFVSAEETETSWKLFQPFLDNGEVNLYRKGKVPRSFFDVDWINFEDTGSLCSGSENCRLKLADNADNADNAENAENAENGGA